jgi:hydrogenase/urease accessory protein HupE
LSLIEVSSGRFLVRWHASSGSLQRELIRPAEFPEPCRILGEYLECGPAGLVGSVEFPWLEGTLTPVMVDIQWLGGERLSRVVTASAPSVKVYGVPEGAGLWGLRPIAVDYVALGIEHILAGFDHLLFVIALAVLVPRRRALIATITAFTLSHSLSLAATVLGIVRLPTGPVEASIALSIVLVCGECLRPADSLTRRAPWFVAFAFGLLHGLGFASALLEVGLPQQHLPAALFCFNVGVELGQLAVIAVFIVGRSFALRLGLRQVWLGRSVIYAMGGIAAYWSLDRILGIFGV